MKNLKPLKWASVISGALFVVFAGLKLAGLLSWSWWTVTSPVWVMFLFVLALVAACAIYLVNVKK